MQTIHVKVNRNDELDPETYAQWLEGVLADDFAITTAKVTLVKAPGSETLWDEAIKVEDQEYEALMTYLIEEGCPAEAISVED